MSTEPTRVLVVDDEDDICRNLADILGDMGLHVDTANDGASALELVRKTPYDVALLDLRMPGMDGVELCRALKAVRSGTVAIIVTAYAGSNAAEEALAAGAWQVVAKPVDLDALLRLVDEAAGQPLVLVVDDDRDLCANLRDLLRDRGCRVTTAHDAGEAAERLREASYRVVLIDMKLPTGGGDEVFRAVRQTNPQARTVLITGYRSETLALIERVLNEGADAVCYKPFDVPKLLDAVRALAAQAPNGDGRGGGGTGVITPQAAGRAADPGKVLIIEDEPDARANLRDILELDDYAVETAATMAEALGRDDWGELAAVLLDRQLPDGSAHRLLPTLRALAPEAAVIVVTGFSDLEGALDAMRLGAADYLLKPVDPDTLRLRVGRLIEQRRLAKAKERSDAIFRHLVEAAEIMVVMLRPDHTIAYFSPHAEQLTGYAAAEVAGRNFLDLFVPPEDREAVAARYRRVLRGEPARAVEGRVVCRDGSARWVLRNARRLGGYEGTDVLLLVAHDITELKQAQGRALQAERLAAIGQMVAGLAHESRNALQRGQACLEMLALKVADRPDALNLIGRIQAAQDDLKRHFEDVRNYAAPVKLERRACDLGAVWREAWAQLDAARDGRPARLVERAGATDLRCDLDPFRIGQVFHNIFDNALAACPADATAEVVVSARPARLGAEPAVRVSVRDNGPGLGPEQRRRLFDAFFTTKTRGTGLGMAIVKRIVDGHGGRVEVGGGDGDGGPGAEIVLTFPRGVA
jgi:PAS domain S-box-containing protein